MREFVIRGEYITLGQLIKALGEVDNGSDVKRYLEEEPPVVNGETEQRRGRKLRPGDRVKLSRSGEVVCTSV